MMVVTGMVIWQVIFYNNLIMFLKNARAMSISTLVQLTFYRCNGY
jgi:hypothetical protein